LGSGGTEWEVADVISASRMNQKTLFVGTGTQIDALSTTYAGMYVYSTDTSGTKVADTLYQRNAANSAWVAWSIVGKQDFPLSAAAIYARITSGSASLAQSESTTNKINTLSLDFDQTTQEYAQFQWFAVRNYNNGTVKFTPYWTASTGSGGVVWGMSGVALSNDDALDTALGTAQTSTDTLIATGDLHVGPQSSAITIAGTPADSDMHIWQISRVTGNGSDTLTGDAKLLGIIVELSLDSGIAA
jgi:hypothetical protein